MDRSTIITISALLVFAGIAMGQYTKGDLAASYTYLNRLRTLAGMTPLGRNAQLERAAEGHAAYLALNGASGHFQKRGRRAYTGNTPAERMRRAGYPGGRNGENAAAGNSDGIEAIDGLMAAIYHRFGFLSFNYDEVGIGMRINADAQRSRYAYNMGDSEKALAKICAELPPDAMFSGSGKYYELCPTRIRVKYEAYPRIKALIDNSIAVNNPAIIMWPPENSTDVPPAFFEESPDPLPDYSVSGYPISLQFNPAFVKSVSMISFKLYRRAGTPRSGRPKPAALTELRSTRLLTRQTDPNKKFSALEFALFPLERLQWNQTYAAHAVFRTDGKRQELWRSFRTRDPGAPIYTVTGRGETLPFKPGKRYVIYLPPAPGRAGKGGYSSSMDAGMKPSVDMLDPHTVRIAFEGPQCAVADLKFGSNRGVKVRLAAEDNTQRVHPPEVLYANCGEFSADFRIAGRGEMLKIASGKTYTVYVQPGKGAESIGRIGWSYTAGLKIDIARKDQNTLSVRASGPTGGRVDVKISQGRTFKLRIE